MSFISRECGPHPQCDNAAATSSQFQGAFQVRELSIPIHEPTSSESAPPEGEGGQGTEPVLGRACCTSRCGYGAPVAGEGTLLYWGGRGRAGERTSNCGSRAPPKTLASPCVPPPLAPR